MNAYVLLVSCLGLATRIGSLHSEPHISEHKAILERLKRAAPEAEEQIVQQVTNATARAHMATCNNTQGAVQEARQRLLFKAMVEHSDATRHSIMIMSQERRPSYGSGLRKDDGLSTLDEANQPSGLMHGEGRLPDKSELSASADAMWGKLKDQMMPEILKAIKFSQMLLGFSELSLEDQVTLIKHGSFEVMMTRFAMLIDHEMKTMLDPSLTMLSLVLEMPMGTFLDGFFNVSSAFNPLGMTDEEIGLYTAVLLFSPIRPGLHDIERVSDTQDLYLLALYQLMKQNHQDPEEKFSQALGLVPMFRRINEEHSSALNAMKMTSPDFFDKEFSPLHKELFLEGQ